MIASAIGLDSMSSSHAHGSLRANRTVYRSRTSTLSTDASIEALALPGTVRKRSTLYTTSSAVSSRPFTGGLACQRTPLRSLKMYVVSLGWVQDSARSPSMGNVPGWMAGPVLCLSRRLWVKEYAMCVLYE